MLKVSVAILTLLGFALAVPEDHWAVLVAGSSGYSNYRHQADICHAYQILRNNGFLEDHIVTLAVDDIAHNLNNPYFGQIFNQPDGEDVYAGCNIDYSRSSVTPDNFMSILKGDGESLEAGLFHNGKVLKTDSESKLFIYFADHGAPGLIAFPSDKLYADELIETINYMYENQLYGEMVIYIEACESGSMFEGLLDENINVYATTAANSEESSWGTYCSPDDVVDGVHIGSCLGDLYSVVWMEDSDAHDKEVETVGQQFQIVKQKTTKSHVQEFGETDLKSFAIGKYQGIFEQEKSASSFFNRLLHASKKLSHSSDEVDEVERRAQQLRSAVSSRDNMLHYLYSKVARTGSHEAQHELMEELSSRMRADRVMEAFLGQALEEVGQTPLPRNFDCLRELVATYEQECGRLTEYSLGHVKYLVKACEMANATVETLVGKLQTACSV